MRDRLLDIAEKAARKAEEFGADQAEVYIGSSRSFSIDVENNAIKNASDKRDAGCGIRSVVGRRIGFAYVTTILEADLLEAAEKSVKLAKASIEDPDFVSLPSAQGSYPEVKGLLDPAIQNLGSEGAADLIVRGVDAAHSTLEKHESAIEAKFGALTGATAIVNSLGISSSAEATSAWMYVSPTIRNDDEQTSSYEFQVSRALKEIDPEWIGRSSAQHALSNLGAKTVEGGEMPLILSPFAASAVIGGGFAGAINAEEVQYGRSYIADAFGEEIAAHELQIVDDGLLAGGVGSRPFDAEGFRSQKTELLENGVLKSLLHNSYTANKDGVENTGNASRPGYSGVPSISTTNLVVAPGKGSLEDLVSEVGSGVLCRFTGDRPNMATGDLSAMIMEGAYIENGEIQHPVKNTLVGINMRDLLRRVDTVGGDTRVALAIISPSIVISSVKITSG
ncbi:MAG: TldD/PmbA family protein [Candidatus Thorarchaeota archaeon]|jgi:PmbA protein